MKYAVHYPISGIHECPFGKEQAEMICLQARYGRGHEGIDAKVVTSEDGVNWS